MLVYTRLVFQLKVKKWVDLMWLYRCCVHVCIFVWCICVCLCTHVCTCGDQRLFSGVFVCHSAQFWDRVSDRTWYSHCLNWLASLCLPELELQGSVTLSGFLQRFWGSASGPYTVCQAPYPRSQVSSSSFDVRVSNIYGSFTYGDKLILFRLFKIKSQLCSV